ncbi:MAG: hypothetical protein ACXITV_11075 [Luteibaculaceae bacterium]
MQLLSPLKNNQLIWLPLKDNQLLLGVLGNPLLNALVEEENFEKKALCVCFNDTQINKAFLDIPEPAWDIIDVKDEKLCINLDANTFSLPKHWPKLERLNLLSVNSETFNFLPANLNLPLYGIVYNKLDAPSYLNKEDIIVTLRPTNKEDSLKFIALTKDGGVSLG